MAIVYRAVLLGSGAALSDLSVYEPQEEATPEGSLILLELDLAEAMSSTTLAGINERCASNSVIPWPGSTQVAYLDPSSTVLTLQWVKGFAWLPVIVGMLVLTVLPTLL